MSIMSGIFGRRAEAKAKEEAAKEVAKAEIANMAKRAADMAFQPLYVAEPKLAPAVGGDAQISAALQEVVLSEPDPVAAPAETSGLEIPASAIDKDQPTATVEVQSEGQPQKVESADAKTEEVQTIPLGDEEIYSLQDHNYDQIKGRFTKTFVIEKPFWVVVENTDVSDTSKPVRKTVKVKRVAEIRAASLMHALQMIGWDNRMVTLVSVKDEYDGGVAIKVDGKPVSKLTIPAELKGADYEAGGRQRNAFVAKLASIAQNDDKVKALLNDLKKPRMVVGHSYEPNQHINLKTAKGKAVQQVAVPVAAPVSEAPVEAPAAPVEAAVSVCPEGAPSVGVAIPDDQIVFKAKPVDGVSQDANMGGDAFGK